MDHSALLLLLALCPLSTATTSNRCQDFSLNDCAGDKATIIFELNTKDEELCQDYCTITPGCYFYRYDSRNYQGISCALFEEPFWVYASHCDEISGSKGFPYLEECQEPADNSCDIIQQGNCAFWGTVEETDTFETVDNCVALCEFLTCDYWVYQREAQKCLLQSNPKTGENKMCNVVFGPPHAENCGEAPEPSTVTPPPFFTTTTGPTAAPDLCDQFPTDELPHSVKDAENCGCFWQCYKGEATHECCANCFLYDIATGWCTNKQDPNFGGCGDRPEKDCDPDPAPGPCPYPFGYYKDDRSCDRYFVCHYSQPHTTKCDKKSEGDIVDQQLLYNYDLVWCDWQDRVDCGDRPICQTVEGDGEDMKYQHCQCQGAHIFPPEDFSCPPSELGIFGDPFNCQKYYFCSEGAIVEMGYCSKDTFWDERAASCITGGKCKGRPVCDDIKNSDNCFCSHE